MKKTKLMLTSLLSLLLLTGCHHETENSTSVSTPEEKPSEQTKTEPFTGTANLTGLSAEEKNGTSRSEGRLCTEEPSDRYSALWFWRLYLNQRTYCASGNQ